MRTLSQLIDACDNLPLISATVYKALLDGLYAEPGFSDVDTSDLAKATGLGMNVVKGALGHLVNEELVTTVSERINGITTEFVYATVHNDGYGWDGTVARRESLKVLEERIRRLNAKPQPTRKQVEKGLKQALDNVTKARGGKPAFDLGHKALSKQMEICAACSKALPAGRYHRQANETHYCNADCHHAHLAG